MKKSRIPVLLIVLAALLLLPSCSSDPAGQKRTEIQLPSGTYSVLLGDASYSCSGGELKISAGGTGESSIDLSGLGGCTDISVLTVSCADGKLKELILPDLPDASITVTGKDIGRIDGNALSADAILYIEGKVEQFETKGIGYLCLDGYDDLSFLPNGHFGLLTLEVSVPLSSLSGIEARHLALRGPGWSLEGIDLIEQLEVLSVHTQEELDYSPFAGSSFRQLDLSGPLDIGQLTCLKQLDTLMVWDDRITGPEHFTDIPGLDTLRLCVRDCRENRQYGVIDADNIEAIDSLRLRIDAQPLRDFVENGGTLMILCDQRRTS